MSRWVRIVHQRGPVIGKRINGRALSPPTLLSADFGGCYTRKRKAKSRAVKKGRAMTEKPLVIAYSSLSKGYAPVFGRIIATLLLGFITAQAAAAYTLVMRSGRRLEIPDTFYVTRTTLSYEAAPGISVSWQLSMIDLAA